MRRLRGTCVTLFPVFCKTAPPNRGSHSLTTTALVRAPLLRFGGFVCQALFRRAIVTSYPCSSSERARSLGPRSRRTSAHIPLRCSSNLSNTDVRGGLSARVKVSRCVEGVAAARRRRRCVAGSTSRTIRNRGALRGQSLAMRDTRVGSVARRGCARRGTRLRSIDSPRHNRPEPLAVGDRRRESDENG